MLCSLERVDCEIDKNNCVKELLPVKSYSDCGVLWSLKIALREIKNWGELLCIPRRNFMKFISSYLVCFKLPSGNK